MVVLKITIILNYSMLIGFGEGYRYYINCAAATINEITVLLSPNQHLVVENVEQFAINE